VGETGVANALNYLGITQDEAGCKQKATAHLQAALALQRRQGDMRGTAETLNNLGALAKDQNQLDEARQFYAEALQFEQALRYDIGVARALFNLGEVDALQGDYGSARRLTALRHASLVRSGLIIGKMRPNCCKPLEGIWTARLVRACETKI
jgi:tetratricopeptide (TPR) repeat protein